MDKSGFNSTIPSIFRNKNGQNRNPSPVSSPTSNFTDIEMSDGTDCVVFSQCDLPNGAFPLMEEMRRNGQLIDVTVLVGVKKFPIDAHKLVLASTMPYFHAMFTHGMMESRQREISLDEEGGTIDPNAFEALVNFAYSGKGDDLGLKNGPKMDLLI